MPLNRVCLRAFIQKLIFPVFIEISVRHTGRFNQMHLRKMRRHRMKMVFMQAFLYRPKPGWRLDAYIDVYKFPWVSYSADMPAAGLNQLIQLFWKPHKKLETYLRFQKESKSLNGPGLSTILMNWYRYRSGFRLQSSFQPYPGFIIRNRIDVNWFEKSGQKEEGFQAYIDFIFKSNVKTICYQYPYCLVSNRWL